MKKQNKLNLIHISVPEDLYTAVKVKLAKTKQKGSVVVRELLKEWVKK